MNSISAPLQQLSLVPVARRLATISRIEAKAAGLKRYFTGKPCCNGHVAERRASNAACTECAYEGSKRRRLENPEKERARVRKYDATHRESRRAANCARRAASPEHVREIQRKSEAKHREARRKKNLKWALLNPEKNAARVRNRHARKKSAEGFHTAEDVARIRSRQGDKCNNPFCAKLLNGTGHVDHILALKNGGSNWPRNLQLLCESCNSSKGAKNSFDWLLSQAVQNA
jgi:5-methylcytosine-specific restriction endonuclease McrA